MREAERFSGLDLDALRPQPKELMFRGQRYELPDSSPIPTIMEAVQLQEDLREIVGRLQDLSDPLREAAAEYGDSGKELEEALKVEYADDAEREKMLKPLEEAFDACQGRYVEIMERAAGLEGEQAALNGKLLDIVMELIRDVPGQEDTPPLRVTPDEAFSIIGYVGGSRPGNMLDDAVADAITGEETPAEPDPTKPQAEQDEKPPKPSRPRPKSGRSRKPSPARS